MKQQTLTIIELGLMLQALGWITSNPIKGIRTQKNSFIAEPGSEDDKIWIELVKRELAGVVKDSSVSYGNNYYVTFSGAELLVNYSFNPIPHNISSTSEEITVKYKVERQAK